MQPRRPRLTGAWFTISVGELMATLNGLGWLLDALVGAVIIGTIAAEGPSAACVQTLSADCDPQSAHSATAGLPQA
jgi:hypothetical protein